MSLSLDLSQDRWLAEEVKLDELFLSGRSQKRLPSPPDHDDRVQACGVEFVSGSDASVRFTRVKRRTTLLTGEVYFEGARDVSLHNLLVRFNCGDDAQLNLQNADSGDSKIGGMIALDQVDAFMQLLMQKGGVLAERRATAAIILDRA